MVWGACGRSLNSFAVAIASAKTAAERVTVNEVRAAMGFVAHPDSRGNSFITDADVVMAGETATALSPAQLTQLVTWINANVGAPDKISDGQLSQAIQNASTATGIALTG